MARHDDIEGAGIGPYMRLLDAASERFAVVAAERDSLTLEVRDLRQEVARLRRLLVECGHHRE